MNEITKALLKDLQSDLDRIKISESNIEAIWLLEDLKKSIDTTTKLIRKSIS